MCVYIYIYIFILLILLEQVLSKIIRNERSWSTPSLPTKSLDFRRFDSSRLLILRGGNYHVRTVWFYRESPGKFDLRTLSRKTLSRWTGRKRIRNERSWSTTVQMEPITHRRAHAPTSRYPWQDTWHASVFLVCKCFVQEGTGSIPFVSFPEFFRNSSVRFGTQIFPRFDVVRPACFGRVVARYY